MVGFNPTREEPNSHSNLCRYGSTFCIGVGQRVKRPGNLDSSAACSICFFAECDDKRRDSFVRSAAADGDAARL